VNIAGVTIADASIDLSVRLKATATGIADGRRYTVESDSELELKARPARHVGYTKVVIQKIMPLS